MTPNFTTTFGGQLMTFEAFISYAWSPHWQRMQRLVRNEIFDIRAYHHSLHIVCPFIHDILDDVPCGYPLTSKRATS
jgi:hypothetical protein